MQSNLQIDGLHRRRNVSGFTVQLARRPKFHHMYTCTYKRDHANTDNRTDGCKLGLAKYFSSCFHSRSHHSHTFSARRSAEMRNHGLQ